MANLNHHSKKITKTIAHNLDTLPVRDLMVVSRLVEFMKQQNEEREMKEDMLLMAMGPMNKIWGDDDDYSNYQKK